MIRLVGRLSTQGRVGPMSIVVGDPPIQPAPEFRAGLEGMQVDAFVFHGAPEPLDEDVVHPAPPAIHADPHPGILEQIGEARAGELAALVGVEDLRHAEAGQVLLQRLDAEVRLHGIGQPQASTFLFAQSMIATR